MRAVKNQSDMRRVRQIGINRIKLGEVYNLRGVDV
jgi:hypothetical protein